MGRPWLPGLGRGRGGGQDSRRHRCKRSSSEPEPRPLAQDHLLAPPRWPHPVLCTQQATHIGSRRKSVLAWPAPALEKRGVTSTLGGECGEGDQKAGTDRDSTILPRFGGIGSGLLSNDLLPADRRGCTGLGWNSAGGFHRDTPARAHCPSAGGHSPVCCCLGPCPSLRTPCTPALTPPTSVTGECLWGTPETTSDIWVPN